MDLDLLKKLLGRPIAFHRCFAALSGSALAGLFMSQAFYWATRETVIVQGGWFYKTQAEWYQETFMSRSEQEIARRRLRELGLLDEKRKDIPAKLYYRVCFEEVLDALTNDLIADDELPF
jgi:hypothetical protein